jgi:3-hydroxybutyryl-CoA dehydrogenase
MKILVIGEEDSFREFKSRFGGQHEYTRTDSHLEARKSFSLANVVFDFIIDEDQSQFQLFDGIQIPVFLNTVKSGLRGILDQEAVDSKQFFGFNGLPTFVNRPAFEVTLTDDAQLSSLEKICAQLGTTFEIVEDRPGMVTPRIVCMIINEAYCAIEDRTASADDIDVAMKLGTNYPFGPIEWSKKIGLKNVVELLDAVYRHSGNERYLSCELLRAEASREP